MSHKIPLTIFFGFILLSASLVILNISLDFIREANTLKNFAALFMLIQLIVVDYYLITLLIKFYKTISNEKSN